MSDQFIVVFSIAIQAKTMSATKPQDQPGIHISEAYNPHNIS